MTFYQRCSKCGERRERGRHGEKREEIYVCMFCGRLKGKAGRPHKTYTYNEHRKIEESNAEDKARKSRKRKDRQEHTKNCNNERMWNKSDDIQNKQRGTSDTKVDQTKERPFSLAYRKRYIRIAKIEINSRELKLAQVQAKA